jgi:uncharacterized delta-60 repeat protein
MRRRVLLPLLAALPLLVPPVALAAPAVLDPTFGKDGIVAAFPHGGVATSVGIDDQHRVTVVGYTIERHPDVVVARFEPDGAPDRSFSRDGRARFDLGGDDYAFAAALTPKGGVAITGRRTAREDRIFVLRLNADGKRLRDFSGDGRLLVDTGTRQQSGNAIAFTPQGRLVLGGYLSSGIQARSVLVRVTPGGKLDRSFGGDGIGVYDIGRGTEVIDDLLVLPGGGVVAAGSAENSQQPRFMILRARSDGRLDRSFGRNRGATLIDVAKGADMATALAAAADGDYLLAGSSHGDWAVAAIRPGGNPDLRFANDGHRVLSGGSSFERAAAVVAAGPKAYLIGTVHADTYDLGVARLLHDGSLDPTFSGDGRFRLNPAGTRDGGATGALQPNGKLLVAGQTWRRGTPRFLVARLRTT